MPTLLTFDSTTNGKGIILKTNDAIADLSIDYRSVTIPTASILRIVLEENESDGINILMIDLKKFVVKKESISRIGATNAPFTDNDQVRQLLEDLAGL